MSNSKNTFEESLKKLEKIVEKLEDGNVNLDDSIKSFEEGVALVKECQKQLSEAEIKIQTLLEDGNVEPTEAKKLRPFSSPVNSLLITISISFLTFSQKLFLKSKFLLENPVLILSKYTIAAKKTASIG